ncbi:hypothetical protein LZ31DRAFT_215924 [Colletotrichum somersetense]|nr:hypothetical protein LZ31DRAFT_215924 [Colletotrichum somersetense]
MVPLGCLLRDPSSMIPNVPCRSTYAASPDHVDPHLELAGILNDVIRWCPSRSSGTIAQRTALWLTPVICHPKSRLDGHDDGTEVQRGVVASRPLIPQYLEAPTALSGIHNPESQLCMAASDLRTVESPDRTRIGPAIFTVARAGFDATQAHISVLPERTLAHWETSRRLASRHKGGLGVSRNLPQTTKESAKWVWPRPPGRCRKTPTIMMAVRLAVAYWARYLQSHPFHRSRSAPCHPKDGRQTPHSWLVQSGVKLDIPLALPSGAGRLL